MDGPSYFKGLSKAHYTMETNLLSCAGCSPEVIAHSILVSEKACAIARRVNINYDYELIRLGGLLHDIGRSKTHGIEHALVGVDVARSYGLSEEIIRIIERHIGAGIAALEAERLGLPKKDYLPLTPEEKIVSYADNLTCGVRELSFAEALERFKAMLGPAHEGIALFLKQHDEIRFWMQEVSDGISGENSP